VCTELQTKCNTSFRGQVSQANFKFLLALACAVSGPVFATIPELSRCLCEKDVTAPVEDMALRVFCEFYAFPVAVYLSTHMPTIGRLHYGLVRDFKAWDSRIDDRAVDLAFTCLAMVTDGPDNFINLIGSAIIAADVCMEVQALFKFAAEKNQKISQKNLCHLLNFSSGREAEKKMVEMEFLLKKTAIGDWRNRVLAAMSSVSYEHCSEERFHDLMMPMVALPIANYELLKKLFRDAGLALSCC